MADARADVLGCRLDRLDMAGTVARCRALIEARTPAQHVSVNAAKLVSLRSDARLREIMGRAELATADGMSVVWASRLLGDTLPTRVAGIDLMSRLLELAEQEGYRVYILGARAEVLERAVANIRRRHPTLVVAGYRDGYFADADAAHVATEIRSSQPDILFVAMSSPRKEYFVDEHREALGTPLLVGVGGSVDVWAGVARRAPAWMQAAGLEWLYRLIQEPRRLWRRYLVSNVAFLRLLGPEIVRRRLHDRRRPAEPAREEAA